MKSKNEKRQKVFVDQEGVATLKCPSCSLQRATRVDPAAIREKNARDSCMVRCTCQTRFAVKLEFRRGFRKPTNLSGEYICLPKGKTRGILKVVNVAEHGFGLEVLDTTQFKIGDKLLVLFNLDDTRTTLIEKSAVVQFVKENYIGCKFLGSLPLGNALKGFLQEEPAHKNDQIENSEEGQLEEDQFDWDSRHWR